MFSLLLILQAQLCSDLILVNSTTAWFVEVSSSIATNYSKMGIEHWPKGGPSKSVDSLWHDFKVVYVYFC